MDYDESLHFLLGALGYVPNVGILKHNVNRGETLWGLQVLRWLDWAAFSAMCSFFRSMPADYRIICERLLCIR